MKFGIIGYGRFGKLWANALLPFGEVAVYDKNTLQMDNPNIRLTSLQEVTSAEILFLLVPISEFENSCMEIKKLITPTTIIVDCCSVKVYTIQIMENIFPENQPLIATHPLFGPDSIKRTGGLSNHSIVICKTKTNPDVENILKQLFTKMKLKILTSTAEEHDKQMATSQCLVHFIGRGLVALALSPQELSTPDFQALLNINTMVANDSWQLFLDMQTYNPYAKEIRIKLINQLIHIDKQIIGGTNNANS